MLWKRSSQRMISPNSFPFASYTFVVQQRCSPGGLSGRDTVISAFRCADAETATRQKARAYLRIRRVYDALRRRALTTNGLKTYARSFGTQASIDTVSSFDVCSYT